MSVSAKRLTMVWLAAVAVTTPAAIAQKSYIAAGVAGEITETSVTSLWRAPKDISSENLFYGRGGQEHAPHGPFTFESEDLDGSNPKYDVRDPDGVKWKIKLGVEAVELPVSLA